MQTILGSTGAVGTLLAHALTPYTQKIRLVSRNPKQLTGYQFELVKADLLDPKAAYQSIKGSEVVYLTVGMAYNSTVWKRDWPILIQHVIQACEETGAKLVFFDNVYLYGKVDGWMVEDCPINPGSKKGEVRAEVVRRIWEAVKRGSLNALIARSADYYGISPLSIPFITVIDPFSKGKAARCLLSDVHLHSYTYLPDAAQATALLGNTESAYNQVWHLPTDTQVLTAKEFIQLAAETFGVKPSYSIISKRMLSLLGIFSRPMREMIEMGYQTEHDYLFSSSKFEATFGKQYMSYQEGMAEIAAHYPKSGL